MARQDIPVQNVPGSNVVDFDPMPPLNFLLADTVNSDSAEFVEGMIIFGWNSHATLNATMRIEAIEDEDLRILNQQNVVPAGGVVAFGPFTKDGWRQINNTIHMISFGLGTGNWAVINPRVG